MAFVVEDGTGLSNSNSYVADTDVDAYIADRGGNAAWTALTTTQKQAACVKATDYIETVFGTRFSGFKNQTTQDTQALSFPRNNALPPLPTNLRKATMEYALRAITVVLLPDPTFDATGLQVTSVEKQVGPIVKKTTYSDVANRIDIIHPYPAADLLLQPLLRAQGAIRN